jgi:hypothetical protein
MGDTYFTKYNHFGSGLFSLLHEFGAVNLISIFKLVFLTPKGDKVTFLLLVSVLLSSG